LPSLTPPPYTTLFRSCPSSRPLFRRFFPGAAHGTLAFRNQPGRSVDGASRTQFSSSTQRGMAEFGIELLQRKSANNFVSEQTRIDRKSTRLNSSHVAI